MFYGGPLLAGSSFAWERVHSTSHKVPLSTRPKLEIVRHAPPHEREKGDGW